LGGKDIVVSGLTITKAKVIDISYCTFFYGKLKINVAVASKHKRGADE
jgi:hypothetical protein